eukprot:366265-Chlamydomonas_euryale.AAC.4
MQAALARRRDVLRVLVEEKKWGGGGRERGRLSMTCSLDATKPSRARRTSNTASVPRACAARASASSDSWAARTCSAVCAGEGAGGKGAQAQRAEVREEQR